MKTPSASGKDAKRTGFGLCSLASGGEPFYGRSPRRATRVWVYAVCALAALSAASWAGRQDSAEDLTARIQHENNPVKKAKLEVRLARLEVGEATSAYDHRQLGEGQKLLSASVGEMQNAWNLLRATGRDAARKPDGFMQLEIGSRENARLLNELRQRTFYLYRGPIDETLKTLNDIHSQVLAALFPGAAPPAGKGGEKTKVSTYQRDGGAHP